MQHGEEAGAPVGDAERLQAALEALAARDQVLADRTRRLAALEDAAARLAATAARLEAAETELVALRHARRAESAQYETRLADLERRLLAEATGAPSAPREGEEPDPGQVGLGKIQADLDAERLRNFRLAGRSPAPAPAETARLELALAEAQSRAARLERELAELRATRDEAGAYARWEGWFRQRLSDRVAADWARDRETIRLQRAVLGEKEALIATLIERLRAAGEIQEGPDDLKEIVGIGPVIEQLLHGLGITTFEQLAALSAEDAERIAEHLGAFHERIARDRWQEQAADLAARRLRLGPTTTLR